MINISLETGDVLKWNNFPGLVPENQKTNWFIVLYPCNKLPTLIRLTSQEKPTRLKILRSVARCLQKDSYIDESYVRKDISFALIQQSYNDIEFHKKCMKGNEIRAVLKKVKDGIPKDRFEKLNKIKMNF